MSVNELKEEWDRLFATGAPNNSRSYLEIHIAYRIQELIHGGLSRKSRQMLKALSALATPGKAVPDGRHCKAPVNSAAPFTPANPPGTGWSRNSIR
ncbi:MAG: DUF2924 domain-containing protein [Rhodobacteraceae bacterium]|nr:DUF2924 domain-containing protein [Paracoccaceae bacterium]